LCRSVAARIASGSRSQSGVLPSMSVNKKVSVCGDVEACIPGRVQIILPRSARRRSRRAADVSSAVAPTDERLGPGTRFALADYLPLAIASRRGDPLAVPEANHYAL